MAIPINYQKRKNVNLFTKFQTNKNINLSNSQNYIPIYDRFFALNNTNWNSINLNHQWAIFDISDLKNTEKESDNVFNCKLKHITDDDSIIQTQKVFIKNAPLLDPFKYLLGKYDHTNLELFNLPSIDKTCKVHPKIACPNNSSFIDGFFSFLLSKVLHDHKFIHGIDYYGSFLAIKNNYKINIIDDLEYLIKSDFFNKQKGKLFTVEDYSHLISCNQDNPLQPLKISTSLKSGLSVKSINDDIFENIFDNNSVDIVSLDDIKHTGVELEDITHSNCFDIFKQHNSDTFKASSASCSSRTSHTNDNDINGLDENENMDDEMNDDNNDCLEDECDNDENTYYSDILSSDNQSVMLTFPKFPVQIICMEKCENTFDDLILNEKLSDDELFSALMQIIMMLISYQKMFAFTHNDLHTNNVMYVSTNKKFIYYVYKKKIYKVPTFGKIYKIIDFGRAIYKFNGKIFCSDSFQQGGDAASQYNTEPFFNDKKPRLEPNFSFDLCRLACSMFDYVVDEFEMIKHQDISPLVKLIIEWCSDDNGINMLYKNNGIERYPDFKLYKMIARHVHNHTPQSQLERKEFNKYLVKQIQKNEFTINIDELPIYV